MKAYDPKAAPDDEKTVDTKTAAAYLGITPPTLRGWLTREDAPVRAVQVNRQWVWKVSDLMRAKSAGGGRSGWGGWDSGKDERDLAIKARRDAGLSLKQIGQEFGISADRVRQILHRLDRLSRYAPRTADWCDGLSFGVADALKTQGVASREQCLGLFGGDMLPSEYTPEIANAVRGWLGLPPLLNATPPRVASKQTLDAATATLERYGYTVIPPPGEGPKFDGFKAALEALCRAYGVTLSTSGHDGLQVWDAGPEPLHCAGIEDRTKPIKD